jgi:peptidyl-prolyl cis-trans isomerase C
MPEPVKAQFGNHIIRVDDERPVQIPSVADVNDKIADALRQKALLQWEEGLKKNAKIVISDAK